MTVEAVPHHDEAGRRWTGAPARDAHDDADARPRRDHRRRRAGRYNPGVFLLRGAELRCPRQKVAVYVLVHELALLIPVVSVAGAVFTAWLQRRTRRRLRGDTRPRFRPGSTFTRNARRSAVVLGGVTSRSRWCRWRRAQRLLAGRSSMSASVSMAIIVALMWRLLGELSLLRGRRC
ncbi:MAG: hypothetical protein R3E41_02180 [Burkholderiaceae bacterium]